MIESSSLEIIKKKHIYNYYFADRYIQGYMDQNLLQLPNSSILSYCMQRSVLESSLNKGMTWDGDHYLLLDAPVTREFRHAGSWHQVPHVAIVCRVVIVSWALTRAVCQDLIFIMLTLLTVENEWPCISHPESVSPSFSKMISSTYLRSCIDHLIRAWWWPTWWLGWCGSPWQSYPMCPCVCTDTFVHTDISHRSLLFPAKTIWM